MDSDHKKKVFKKNCSSKEFKKNFASQKPSILATLVLAKKKI